MQYSQSRGWEVSSCMEDDSFKEKRSDKYRYAGRSYLLANSMAKWSCELDCMYKQSYFNLASNSTFTQLRGTSLSLQDGLTK